MFHLQFLEACCYPTLRFLSSFLVQERMFLIGAVSIQEIFLPTTVSGSTLPLVLDVPGCVAIAKICLEQQTTILQTMCASMKRHRVDVLELL